MEKLEKISEDEIQEIKKDLIAKVKKLIEEGKPLKHIILLGRYAVGKTTLMVKYLTNKFSKPKMTFVMNRFLKQIKYHGKDYCCSN